MVLSQLHLYLTFKKGMILSSSVKVIYKEEHMYKGDSVWGSRRIRWSEYINSTIG